MPKPIAHPACLYHWKPARLSQRLALSAIQKEWLINTQSLTANIRSLCPQMEVVVLSEKWQRPLASEAQKLGMTQHEFAWVRCVILNCQEADWVYARTVIPKMQAGNPWFALKRLGNQPLGEVLFNLKQVQRSPFHLIKTAQAWPHFLEAEVRYGRQSVFTQHNAKLLLTEVFLPSLQRQLEPG